MSKIDQETALVEFERWCDAMDIDTNTDALDDEDRKAFEKQRSRIVRALVRGAAALNDNDEIVVHPGNPKSKYTDPITFHERDGAAVMAADGKKKNDLMAKTYAVMGHLTGLPPSTFTKLVGSDIKLCEAIFALLMD